MDFHLLGSGNKKTFPFTFDKSQNLTLKIKPNLATIINVGAIAFTDSILKAIISTRFGDKVIEESIDIIATINNGAIVMTPAINQAKESAFHVYLSGHFKSMSAKEVEVTLITNVDSAPIEGVIDVLPGTPQWDTTPRVFQLIEDPADSRYFGAGVDIPEGSRSFEPEVFRGIQNGDPTPDLIITQCGPNAGTISQHHSNRGKINLHPNCVALLVSSFDNGDGIVTADTTGQVIFNTFK